MDLTIGAHAVRRDGDMWCVTDLWRAAGKPTARRPNDFLAGPGKAFAEFLCDSVDTPISGITKTRKIPGGGGETWTHWQMALAYAKWIDHAFHARVNDVYRAVMSGELRPFAPAPAVVVDLNLVHGPRLRDVPTLRTEISAMCAAAAKNASLSLQRVHGWVRRTFKVSSIHDVGVAIWPAVKDVLFQIILGKLAISATARRQLPPDRRQVAMPWGPA